MQRSSRCDSNIATALGLTLLLLVAFASVALRTPLFVRVGALIAVVLLFAGLRRGIGNVIQRRCFMAVDFAEVSLRDVRTARQGLFDRGPVHFVETIVVPRSAEPSSKPLQPTSGAGASS